MLAVLNVLSCAECARCAEWGFKGDENFKTRNKTRRIIPIMLKIEVELPKRHVGAQICSPIAPETKKSPQPTQIHHESLQPFRNRYRLF